MASVGVSLTLATAMSNVSLIEAVDLSNGDGDEGMLLSA
jgi:hypothetical protein